MAGGIRPDREREGKMRIFLRGAAGGRGGHIEHYVLVLVDSGFEELSRIVRTSLDGQCSEQAVVPDRSHGRRGQRGGPCGGLLDPRGGRLLGADGHRKKRRKDQEQPTRRKAAHKTLPR